MASHGVEGEGVDSRWEAGHVTHLLFPVGSHGDGAHPGVRGRPLGESDGSRDTWKSPGKVEIRVLLKTLRMWGVGERRWGLGFTEGTSDSTLEESSNSLFWGRESRDLLFLANKFTTYNMRISVSDWHEHNDTISGLC